VAGRSVVRPVQAGVGRDEEDDVASWNDHLGHAAQGSGVVDDVLQDVDGQDGVHRRDPRIVLAQVEWPHLDIRPAPEASGELVETGGVDVRDDETLVAAEFGGEVTQPGSDLQDRPATVRLQELEEVSAVANGVRHDLQTEGVVRFLVTPHGLTAVFRSHRAASLLFEHHDADETELTHVPPCEAEEGRPFRQPDVVRHRLLGGDEDDRVRAGRVGDEYADDVNGPA